MTRVRQYRLFGLTVESPLVLPCPVHRARRPPQVRFSPAAPRRFAQLHRRARSSGKRPWFLSERLPDGRIYLEWTNLFQFLISPDGGRVWYRRAPGAAPESFRTYLLGQVLSFPLLALGYEPLHGTVVSAGGDAIAFLGDCGHGKSTLAAGLLARGWRLVTDDVIVVVPRPAGWQVHPGIPRIKLFPRVAQRVLGLAGCTTMNDGTSKLILPLNGSGASQPATLRAIYVLGPPAEPVPRQPRVEPLAGRDAFFEIVRAAFNLMVVDRDRQARQFAFASRLAREVPVRRLTYPRRLTALPAVCDLLGARQHGKTDPRL